MAESTLVDRRTGYLRLVQLPDGRGAEQLRAAMLSALAELPPLAQQTLAWHQCSEMACRHRIAEYFTDGIFAPLASPWLRVAPYLWRDPPSIGSIVLAPSGGLKSCRTAAAVKVERPTGRTTLIAARTDTDCSPRTGQR